jgi:hypothetical protein
VEGNGFVIHHPLSFFSLVRGWVAVQPSGRTAAYDGLFADDANILYFAPYPMERTWRIHPRVSRQSIDMVS